MEDTKLFQDYLINSQDMNKIEEDLQKLLAGEVVSMKDENLSLQAISKTDEFKPVVKRTVCYIVIATVFDDTGRVALIQEAKASCHGLWYLPAGRVEPGENLVDSVKREVLEESGLEFEPLTVTCIELYDSPNWQRVNYVGYATGGQLKTLAQKDEESLQAKWFTVNEILSGYVTLRHQDFFKSLKLAEAYIAASKENRHPAYQIGIEPHSDLVHRSVIVRKLTERSAEILIYKKNGSCIPSYCMKPCDSGIMHFLYYVFRDVFNVSFLGQTPALVLKGLLTIEHCGIPAREHDGICLTTVCIVPSELTDNVANVTNPNYEWHKISDPDILKEFNRRISKENLLIPILH